MELIFMIPGYKSFAIVYTILGVITAVLCNKESVKQRYSPFEWVAMSFVFPIVTYLVMLGKRYTSSNA